MMDSVGGKGFAKLEFSCENWLLFQTAIFGHSIHGTPTKPQKTNVPIKSPHCNSDESQKKKKRSSQITPASTEPLPPWEPVRVPWFRVKRSTFSCHFYWLNMKQQDCFGCLSTGQGYLFKSIGEQPPPPESGLFFCGLNPKN